MYWYRYTQVKLILSDEEESSSEEEEVQEVEDDVTPQDIHSGTFPLLQFV